MTSKQKSIVTIIVLELVGTAIWLLFWWISQRQGTIPTESLTNLPNTTTAYFAAGPARFLEADWEKAPGVSRAIVGYAGGWTDNPNSENVVRDNTGHVETIEVHYDPAVIPYEILVRYFFAHIKPTQSNGQFEDIGPQYHPTAFYKTYEEKALIEKEITYLTDRQIYPEPITVSVRSFSDFFRSDRTKQNYSKQHFFRYTFALWFSERNDYLRQVCEWRRAKDVSCEGIEKGL